MSPFQNGNSVALASIRGRGCWVIWQLGPTVDCPLPPPIVSRLSAEFDGARSRGCVANRPSSRYGAEAFVNAATCFSDPDAGGHLLRTAWRHSHDERVGRSEHVGAGAGSWLYPRGAA